MESNPWLVELTGAAFKMFRGAGVKVNYAEAARVGVDSGASGLPRQRLWSAGRKIDRLMRGKTMTCD